MQRDSDTLAACAAFSPLRSMALTLALLVACSQAAASRDRDPVEMRPSGTPLTTPQLLDLAYFFERAQPPTRDLARSKALYCRAAARGSVDALIRLGWIYLRGESVIPDRQVAATMFRWAAALGSEQAAAIERTMPPSLDLAPQCLHGEKGAALAALIRERSGHPSPETVIASLGRAFDFSLLDVPPEHRRIAEKVVREAQRFRLDPRLVLAVMQLESNFDPSARSHRNARGLMQLMPATAERFNVQDLHNPLENLRGGMAYLRWLLAYYGGNVKLAVAAYNAGEGAVDRFKGVPPYRETRAYVRRILEAYPFDRHPYDAKVLGRREPSAILAGHAR